MSQVLFSGFYALGAELSSEMRGAFRATETARSPQRSWKEQTCENVTSCCFKKHDQLWHFSVVVTSSENSAGFWRAGLGK